MQSAQQSNAELLRRLPAAEGTREHQHPANAPRGEDIDLRRFVARRKLGANCIDRVGFAVALSRWQQAGSVLLALLVCAGCAGHGEMHNNEETSHPLAGRLWDGHRQAFASEQDLRTQLLGADFVLLGEVHDNPAHHARQREWLEWIATSGKKPLIALEQFDKEHQHAIDAVWDDPTSSLDAVFEAAQFQTRSWDRNFYAPLVAIARRNGWPLAAPTCRARRHGS
jgi:hypothetical protein